MAESAQTCSIPTPASSYSPITLSKLTHYRQTPVASRPSPAGINQYGHKRSGKVSHHGVVPFSTERSSAHRQVDPRQ
jgi:hypothetical protein